MFDLRSWLARQLAITPASNEEWGALRQAQLLAVASGNTDLPAFEASKALARSYDLTLHLAPDGLELQVNAHRVQVPTAEAGAVAERILRARVDRPQGRIGTGASPTQHLVNLWLKDHKPTSAAHHGLDLKGISL